MLFGITEKKKKKNLCYLCHIYNCDIFSTAVFLILLGLMPREKHLFGALGWEENVSRTSKQMDE